MDYLSYLLFAIPGLIIGMYAQIKLTSAYNRFVRVPTRTGTRGADAARQILDRAGMPDMPVREVRGHLTDHYDPLKKALFLSSENYHGHSLAAVGVAAHEAGHALQDQAAYAPLKFRMALVPITQFASHAWMWIFILGMIFNFAHFITAALVIFSIITLFQLVTLPVEFDASRRAKQELIRLGLIQSEERTAVSKVLNAAALTYVAALIASVMQLLYFIMIARGSSRG